MSENGFLLLREAMERSYGELKRRLTLQLGSADLADDALHETWLRLSRGKGSGAPVQFPLSYLLRMATNAAVDRLRAESRFLSGAEVDTLFENLAEPTPGPEVAVEERDELRILASLLHAMPPRRRQILLLTRVEGLARQEVATRFGVSLSLVDRELRRAQEYLAERMP